MTLGVSQSSCLLGDNPGQTVERPGQVQGRTKVGPGKDQGRSREDQGRSREGPSRVGKCGFYGFCRTQLFGDFPPNLSCFPPNCNQNHIFFWKSYLTKVYQIYQINKNFTKFYQFFTKFVTYSVLLRLKNPCNLRIFSPSNLYPKKVRVDKQLLFPTLGPRQVQGQVRGSRD